MIVIDRHSGVPVYEQIKEQIMTLINVGVYLPHTRLPSIRAVAVEAGINVNTVKKAFAELELSGVIYSVPGTGSFVCENALSDTKLRNEAFKAIEKSLLSAKSRGITADEVYTIMSRIFKEEITDD